MKKLLIVAAILFAAVAANAQSMYVGGSLGFWQEKTTLGLIDVKTTTFNIMPEVGMSLSDHWSVGTVIGFDQKKVGGADAINTFTIAPYARYAFYQNNLISLFVDGGFNFATSKQGSADAVNSYGVGLKPGFAINVSDNFCILAHYGFLGYQSYSDGNDGLGLNLDGNALSFGVYYSF